MPGDLMIDWPLPTSRDAFFARVSDRAGAITIRRRRLRQTPAAVAALGLLAVVVAAALPGGGAPAQSLRTADNGEQPVFSEERSVDRGDASVGAGVEAYDPTGAGTGARVAAKASTGGAQADQSVVVNPRPATSLSGHPLLTDPRDQVADSPNDLLSGDIRLHGDDELVFRVEVVDLSAFRSGRWGNALGVTFSGTAFGDMELTVRTSLDTSLRPSEGSHALGHGLVTWRTDVAAGGGAQGVHHATSVVPTIVEADEKSSSVVFRIRLSDINAAVRSNDAMTARRTQGDITFAAGTRLGRLAMSANSGGLSDTASAPADHYWAIGD